MVIHTHKKVLVFTRQGVHLSLDPPVARHTCPALLTGMLFPHVERATTECAPGAGRRESDLLSYSCLTGDLTAGVGEWVDATDSGCIDSSFLLALVQELKCINLHLSWGRTRFGTVGICVDVSAILHVACGDVCGRAQMGQVTRT